MNKWQMSVTGRMDEHARGGSVRDWWRWAPYAAVAWSLVYAVLAAYWAVSGSGFPYTPGPDTSVTGPVAGRFGEGVGWAIVIAVGLPAAALGAAMLRRVRVLRPFFIAAGGLLSGTLLLLMTDVSLLTVLAYTPYGIISLLTGTEVGQAYIDALAQWTLAHQLLCLTGGFLWLGATVAYARLSAGACPSCGRRDGPEGWTSPESAARWGRVATYIAMSVPVIYAITRFAWALGIPLGISDEFLREGQEIGMWTSGLALAAFGLVGAVLMLGLVQRWGEVFPRWMIGVAGKRVPIALAVVPASIVSVLMIVGGIAMWSGYAQIVGQSVAGGTADVGFIGALPTALFPVWGVALALATLAYYYRRRGVCGRGTSGVPDEAQRANVNNRAAA
jgi:hypothetical protein